MGPEQIDRAVTAEQTWPRTLVTTENRTGQSTTYTFFERANFPSRPSKQVITLEQKGRRGTDLLRIVLRGEPGVAANRAQVDVEQGISRASYICDARQLYGVESFPCVIQRLTEVFVDKGFAATLRLLDESPNYSRLAPGEREMIEAGLPLAHPARFAAAGSSALPAGALEGKQYGDYSQRNGDIIDNHVVHRQVLISGAVLTLMQDGPLFTLVATSEFNAGADGHVWNIHAEFGTRRAVKRELISIMEAFGKRALASEALARLRTLRSCCPPVISIGRLKLLRLTPPQVFDCPKPGRNSHPIWEVLAPGVRLVCSSVPLEPLDLLAGYQSRDIRRNAESPHTFNLCRLLLDGKGNGRVILENQLKGQAILQLPVSLEGTYRVTELLEIVEGFESGVMTPGLFADRALVRCVNMPSIALDPASRSWRAYRGLSRMYTAFAAALSVPVESLQIEGPYVFPGRDTFGGVIGFNPKLWFQIGPNGPRRFIVQPAGIPSNVVLDITPSRQHEVELERVAELFARCESGASAIRSVYDYLAPFCDNR